MTGAGSRELYRAVRVRSRAQGLRRARPWRRRGRWCVVGDVVAEWPWCATHYTNC